MAIPIINNWKSFFSFPHEGLGSSYERVILNQLLLDIKESYSIRSVLEAPVFGFTGLTGLNSLALAKAGCTLSVVDNNLERTELVSDLYRQMSFNVEVVNTELFTRLPFPDQSQDLSWNFSAIWFVEDLSGFLQELSRITRKVILICVPNQSGLGYKWQKANSEIPEDFIFNERFIEPGLIKHEMKHLGWKYIKGDYIDCPPWPDIGMNKEKFIGKYVQKLPIKFTETAVIKPISIIDYYRDQDPGFPKRMLRYSLLEQFAPQSFKKIWAHHRWMLFQKQDNE